MVMMEQNLHTPVMKEQVLECLALEPGQTVVDATVGMGGHSAAILERIGPQGRLIAIDRDQESLELAKKNLEPSGGAVDFVHGNFSDIARLLKERGIEAVDAILFDLGISSFQLQNPERGFSFQAQGPLDMRLDRTSYICAYDLVNNLTEEELSHLLWLFGQERWHNRIARILVQQRQRQPISTTQELSTIVLSAIPARYRRYHYRIHPATRTFQAVRIAVNRELEALERALEQSIDVLRPGGRLCVISFHSLEDRIVKLALRKAQAAGTVTIITPKPLTPRQSEVMVNPRSRSAKFRVAQKDLLR